jgi:glycosyltransferase involved in cell wall biosynthesis
MKHNSGIQRMLFLGLVFFAASYVLGQTPDDHYKVFEIVIPSYNNAEWAERNLMSVCFQNYPRDKYHVTYINDASTDGTGKIVTDFIERNGLEKYVTLINNTTRKGQLENRFRAFQSVPDHTIIAECDGDDFYADDNVLAELNALFQDQNTWMAYEIILRTFPGNRISKIEPFTYDEILYHSFRDFLNRPTWPVRCYYAWLFKQVKLKDLLYDGNFYPVLTDPAYMIPMLEMAGFHNQYITKILYIRNRGNPLAAIKTWSPEFRKKVYAHLSSQEPYDLIDDCDELLRKKNQVFPVDVCICCTSEACAEKILSLVYENFVGIDNCTVFLEALAQPFYSFQIKKNTTFNVTFKLYDPSQISLQKIFTDYVSQATCKYLVVLADENVCFNKKIDLSWCVNVLDGCWAKIWYFGVNNMPVPKETVPCVEVKQHVWAHQFKYQGVLGKSNFQLNKMMCSREFLLQLIKQINFKTVNDLNGALEKCQLPSNEVGLFFDLK